MKFSGKSCFYLSRHALVACSSLSRCGALTFVPPFHITMSVCISVLKVSFRQPYRRDLMGAASLIFLENTISHQTSNYSGSYKLSCSSSFIFLSLRCRNCDGDGSLWAGYHTINPSLHLDQLWFVLVVRKSLFVEG